MTTVTKRAYGRVNLIGEHTDYNNGWVLPTAIPQYTEVILKGSPGKEIHIISTKEKGEGSKREVAYTLGEENRTGTWTDYLQGATKLLQLFDLKNGFSASITSTIPEGSGLSSSAALEMSFLMAIREYFHLRISDIELARIGQRIENDFVGARVGIMDQMATSLARSNEALYLDTQNLQYERIPLPMNGLDLLVINSGIKHKLSAQDGGYNQRRDECEEINKILGKSLRDTTLDEIKEKNISGTLLKRANHVITENIRVHKAVEAIKKKDFEVLGELFRASHESMKNDYEISIPEIDFLVDVLNAHPEVYGARMTGGGFGGSVVAITKHGKKDKVAMDVIPHYEKATHAKGTLLV